MIVILLITIILTALTIFIRLRQPNIERQWTNQTFGERISLSIMLAATIQFLFFTMLPGWIVAAYLIGKGEFAETTSGNAIWGTVMVIVNTLFYLPIFYLSLKALSNMHKKKTTGRSLELISISSSYASASEEKSRL